MTTELIRPGDALVDRIRTLRSVLPALASEVAIARREAARLRRENAAMQSRIAELEDGGTTGIALPLTSPPAPRQWWTAGGGSR